MKCPRCGTVIPEGMSWCLACRASGKEARESVATEPPAASIEEALRMQEAGLLDDAIRECLHVLRVDHRNVQAYVLLGDLCEVEHRYREAMEAYREAVHLDANNAETRAKFDRMIDKVFEHDQAGGRAAPPPQIDEVPVSEEEASVAAPLKVKIASAPEPVIERHAQPLLTPERARVIIIAAVLIALISLLVNYQPWRRQPPPSPITIGVPGRAPSDTPPENR